MSATLDILRSYRDPAGVLRRRMAGGREDRALATLMLACALVFVAQWPRLSREAFLDPSIALEARLGGALLGWMFLAPLMLYAMAALSHLVAKLFGGRASWFGARMALFWALLAAAPLWLLNGLAAGFIGPGPLLQAFGLAAFGAFLGIWLTGLVSIERKGEAPA